MRNTYTNVDNKVQKVTGSIKSFYPAMTLDKTACVDDKMDNLTVC